MLLFKYWNLYAYPRPKGFVLAENEAHAIEIILETYGWDIDSEESHGLRVKETRIVEISRESEYGSI